ncbi:hypothetical protein QQ054_10735 [Oscillatoria amoena NRMC-F 0135]|nr:hypothetical protein [Oscillatoria amoena NRMC-F 0135]
MAKQNVLGNKTQTRRPGISKIFDSENLVFSHMEFIEARGKWAAVFEGNGERFNCYSDFGGPGDWLWQRETFSNNIDKNKPLYKADVSGLPENLLSGTKWTPAIHAPLSSARAFMLITGVRVERLNKISRQDALSEGMIEKDGVDAVSAYMLLWNQLYRQIFPFEANPRVWVITYKAYTREGFEAKTGQTIKELTTN